MKHKQAPQQITLTFELLGDDAEKLKQYLWLKRHEKTTLPAYIHAWVQCETSQEGMDDE